MTLPTSSFGYALSFWLHVALVSFLMQPINCVIREDYKDRKNTLIVYLKTSKTIISET